MSIAVNLPMITVFSASVEIVGILLTVVKPNNKVTFNHLVVFDLIAGVMGQRRQGYDRNQ